MKNKIIKHWTVYSCTVYSILIPRAQYDACKIKSIFFGEHSIQPKRWSMNGMRFHCARRAQHLCESSTLYSLQIEHECNGQSESEWWIRTAMQLGIEQFEWQENGDCVYCSDRYYDAWCQSFLEIFRFSSAFSSTENFILFADCIDERLKMQYEIWSGELKTNHFEMCVCICFPFNSTELMLWWAVFWLCLRRPKLKIQFIHSNLNWLIFYDGNVFLLLLLLIFVISFLS